MSTPYQNTKQDVPVIDIEGLVRSTSQKHDVVKAIGNACRENGFFYIINHGIDVSLQKRLEEASKLFFAFDQETKMEIAMAKGGRAWRGYFPVGYELTSGKPDLKEGVYFGEELALDHPNVQAGLPFYGENLFPREPAELKPVVLDYMTAMTQLGHTLMRGLSLSLGLEEHYFHSHYTKDPLILFRIFHYPAAPHSNSSKDETWGVGEHTDYGVLTILKQDENGGLEVKTKSGWVEAPPLENAFVCNIGDMLDRMTGGRYRSTPHRVKNKSGRSRLSYPFFFDPNFNAKVEPLPLVNKQRLEDNAEERWDKTSIHKLSGTYGEYLQSKVSKVFPDLKKQVLK